MRWQDYLTPLDWLPDWLASLIILALAAGIAIALFRLVTRFGVRLAGRVSPFLSSFVARSEGPVGAVLMIAVVGATLPGVPLPSGTVLVIGHTLLIAFIAALGWAAVNAVDLSSELYMRRLRLDVEDNLKARKQMTQIRILRRAVVTLIVVLTAAIGLTTIPEVRQYGVSLFASAGAAGLVVGLAARPVLSNLIAGIQIALTQPIRLEDAVIVENEWGWIETIGSTYVVVRLWDLRRMIVPLTFFIEQPFQNWTHESAELIGSVFLHVDYSVPVPLLRGKLEEIARASPLWDGKVVNLQVTDTPEGMVELRALVSARNASIAWDLRCEVREKMLAFLQAEYPNALPRQRLQMVREPRPAPMASAPMPPAPAASSPVIARPSPIGGGAPGAPAEEEPPRTPPGITP